MPGGVRKQGNRWIGLWREGGVKKSKVVGLCKEMTKTAAREAVAEIVRRVKNDANIALFGAFVDGPFFSFYSRKWKESTRNRNEQRIRYYLVREFRDCELSSFRRDELQDFLDAKAKTLSFSTVNHLRWDLKQIFNMAQAEGLVQRNPAGLLFTPREARTAPRRVMSPDQIKNVFGILDIRERLITKLAVLAGMRPGEIFGLKWGDVDENSLEIKRRVYEGVLDSPKSGRGVRTVGLGPDLAREMQKYRTGTGGKAESFVFPSERGTPLRQSNIWRRSVQPKLLKKGLGWVNFQVMRRTFITLGKESGGDPKALADQAGHDIGVSVSVYTQTPIESKLKIVNALEKMIFG
ncbi:MAG TPA: tyrosine-type recombinase/integrase [Bryobacteraceae bacterium]|nr:tyrosine-type recombinase/integrase [Bryobacteraceae bacterium]